MATATVCWRCGEPFTEDDPPTADHVVPRAEAGTNDPANYRPAHASCNSRAGVELARRRTLEAS